MLAPPTDATHSPRSFCRYRVYRDNSGNISAIDASYLQELNSDFKKGEGLQALSQATVLIVTLVLYCIHGVLCHRRIHAVEAQLEGSSGVLSEAILTSAVPKSSKSLQLGSVANQIGALRGLKRRIYAVIIMCGVSMVLRSAFNICEKDPIAPPIPRCAATVAPADAPQGSRLQLSSVWELINNAASVVRANPYTICSTTGFC